jgi:hypothetical protein
MIIPQNDFVFVYKKRENYFGYSVNYSNNQTSSALGVIEWCSDQFGTSCHVDYDWGYHKIPIPFSRWAYHLEMTKSAFYSGRMHIFMEHERDGHLLLFFLRTEDAAIFRLAFNTMDYDS